MKMRCCKRIDEGVMRKVLNEGKNLVDWKINFV